MDGSATEVYGETVPLIEVSKPSTVIGDVVGRESAVDSNGASFSEGVEEAPHPDGAVATTDQLEADLDVLDVEGQTERSSEWGAAQPPHGARGPRPGRRPPVEIGVTGEVVDVDVQAEVPAGRVLVNEREDLADDGGRERIGDEGHHLGAEDGVKNEVREAAARRLFEAEHELREAQRRLHATPEDADARERYRKALEDEKAASEWAAAITTSPADVA